MNRPHVVVVGAGLAGLSAAIGAVDRDMRVTLFEGRPRLGGATWSFERKGLMFDNGQHVYLACCSAYRRYLSRIGSDSKAPLRRLAIPVLRPSGDGRPAEVAWIRRNWLPAPLHLAASLGRYHYLSLAERSRIARAALALRRLDLEDPELDDETFEHFLLRHGQSPRAIRVLWDLISLPTVNVRADEASLFLAAKVFQTGLLARNDAADIGWSEVPLTELHVDPALAILAENGATVRSRAKVTALTVNEDSTSVTGVVIDGETVNADAVILAVNANEVVGLLPQSMRGDFEGVIGLGSSPIVDVNIIYDRKIMNYQVAAGVDTPVQFVFDRSRAAGLGEGEGQCLAISISGADDEHGERPEVLIDRYEGTITDLFPLARAANVIDAVVSREHHATFRGIPGTNRLRPGVETKLHNLVLAGSYTDTGWPATMEGAVRSGERAVDHLAKVFTFTPFAGAGSVAKEAI
ncbi:MAG TPA: hydroxysqualene dehydroxylase HpnE [Acidimicrobiales bacterium]|nr:hydroxysqualene dehydroxylase HpnE [Acidimicrobiales bacterium]